MTYIPGSGTGTVTSVGLAVPGGFSISGSPITTSGTLTIATALAGILKGTGTALAQAVAGTDYEAALGNPASSGYILSSTAAGVRSWIAPAGGGSVTSVGLTMPATFTISGSPVTGAGTLAVAYATQAANLVMAGPATGSAAAPGFRALVAADLPAATTGVIGAVQLAGVLAGTATSPTLAASGVAAATYGSGSLIPQIAVGLDGRITGASNQAITGSLAANARVGVYINGVLQGTRRAVNIITGTNVSASAADNAGTESVDVTVNAIVPVTSVTASGGLAVTGGATPDVRPGVQSANVGLMGPTSGAAAQAAFRSMVIADLPNSGVTAGTYGDATHVPVTTYNAKGQATGVTLAAIAAGGTVTSVSLALPSGIFSVSGSPVTGAGTLTGALISQTANTVLAAPNGSSGAPTFRALAAADIPTLDAAKIGTGTVATARLGSGTANSTTYLRGDQSWATVSSSNDPFAAGTPVRKAFGGGLVIYTVTGTDNWVECDCSGGSGTLFLTNALVGRKVWIKRIDSSGNTLTITPLAGSGYSTKVDGSTSSFTLGALSGLVLACPGDWAGSPADLNLWKIANV